MVRGRSEPSPPTVRDGLVRRRVLVTLINDQGFEGVLWAADESGLHLTGMPGHETGGLVFYRDSVTPEPVDRGDVFVPAEQVLFMQIIGPGS